MAIGDRTLGWGYDTTRSIHRIGHRLAYVGYR